MDKRSLSERDICTKFITPALRRAGWNEMSQIREEVSFTKGRIIVRGKLVTRSKAKRAEQVDHEGEVLEVFATKRRDRRAALTFLKRAMKRYGRPASIVTDRLRSYRAAMNVIGNAWQPDAIRFAHFAVWFALV
jgi:hypothetical protein